MTHEDRVWHHEMETLEGIHEHAERIASLEELVLDMWQEGMCECGSLGKCERCMYDYPTRMRALGLGVAE